MTYPAQITSRQDRSSAEACLYRVAISAFTYYPDKEQQAPGYTLTEDIDWCAAPLAGLPSERLRVLRRMISQQLTDPTADHQAFIAALREHLPDEEQSWPSS
ncbi:MAG TPA: hypothetical protein VJR25_02695 [Microbacterium sp.]|uniref:hypothetical protein n=1 Tax=Microbacterium sp. TaxID=51671 RepID=UPI002B47204D|nr:hypothetical protein [Microbacterium sp.]HKT55657.1 hypothetical protein [Microbacterium sp.]